MAFGSDSIRGHENEVVLAQVNLRDWGFFRPKICGERSRTGWTLSLALDKLQREAKKRWSAMV